MLAAQLGELVRLDHGGAHAGDLVGRHGHADARAADEDAAVGRPLGHATGDLVGKVGVVDTIGRLGAEVLDLVAKAADEVADDVLLAEAGVIGGDDNAHGSSFAISESDGRSVPRSAAGAHR